MSKRTTGRKLAMQALYQADVKKEDIEKVLTDFLDGSRFIKETIEWASYLAKETYAKRDELDKIIKQYSIDWDINRINPIDKNLLRLGLFEMKFTKTVPSIVLNEIIEISKKYSTDESPKFINGILGKYVEKCLPE